MSLNIFKKNPQNDPAPKTPKLLTKEEILSKLLGGEFSDYIEFESETQDDCIYIPELEMNIKPIVFEASERLVSLGFNMYSDVLRSQFFECSVGLGENCESAYGMAIGTFAFSFMQGLKNLSDNNVKYKAVSEFAGHPHSWNVFASNIVGKGQSGESHAPSDYWELLNEDIIKRLGNQKVTYVKVFCANHESNVIGECRINDIPVPELGEKVASIGKNWSNAGYKSEKQFFFIVQDDSTIVDYPYASLDGREKLRSAVAEYLKVFSNIRSQKEYENIVDTVTAITGDKTLASECYSFITEICAERYFEGTFICGDSFNLFYPDNTSVTSYKSQLSDYIPIKEAVFNTFSSNVLGENTDRVFGQLVEMSSIYNAYQQARQSNPDPKGLRVDCMIHNVPADFEIR